MYQLSSFFRSATKPSTDATAHLRPTTLTIFFCLVVGCLIANSPLSAATLTTDSTQYEMGSRVGITGSSFSAGETVHLEITYSDGSPLPTTIQSSWDVVADRFGSISDGRDDGGALDGFLTGWIMASELTYGDALLLTATGESSGYEASTTILSPSGDLHQLHNATTAWHHGNINGSNSCYAEGASVPYRYFLLNMVSGATHYFTIQSEATKGTRHALDYLTQYDLSEAGPIVTVGGPCSNTSQATPGDCASPVSVATFPDPRDSDNYTTSPPTPTDVLALVNAGFPIDGPGDLMAYNATNVLFDLYFYTGSSGAYEFNVVVTFDVIADGSVGFFWGGHLAEGHIDGWGLGNGSGSVSGAPYHMRAGHLDGGGAGWSDRSIQKNVVCLPPDVTITCADGPYCTGAQTTCSVPANGGVYTWDITGGTIVSGQGTETITYEITAGTGETVTVAVEGCSVAGACPSSYCCAEFSVELTVDDCCEIDLTCPADLTIECDESTDPANTGTATYTMIGTCPTPITVSFTDTETPGACDQERTISRLWKVFDGNDELKDECTQTITLVDTTAPDVGCPATVTVECLADVPQPDILLVTAIDNCDPSPVKAFVSDVPDGLTCPKTITRTYKATDDCGNVGYCTQTIIVDDTTPPEMTLPADITVSCFVDVPPANVSLVTATDNCDPSPDVEFVGDEPIGNGCPMTIRRTYRATDACNNSTDSVQIITVDDQEHPEMVIPADITVSCLADVPPADVNSVTATDNCDPPPDVSFVGDVPSGNGCPMTIARTYRATDACGNITDSVQTITVDDQEPPEMTLPADLTVSCLADVPPADVLAVIATDNCDPSPDVFALEDELEGRCPLIITRTYRATDDCGHVTDSVQIITVDDREDPVLTGCPDDITVDCDAVPDWPIVTAWDNCAGDVEVDSSQDSTAGNCLYSYTLVRTWIAADTCDNTASCSQTITVQDTTKPEITCPDDATVECWADVPPPDLGLVTASDNCDPNPLVEWIDDNLIGEACPMTLQRTYQVTDACGNWDTCNQMFLLDDQTPPVFTVFPTDQAYIQCEPAEVCEDLDADDNCGGRVTLSVVDGPGEVSALRWCYTPTGSASFDVTIRAEDTCGNFVDDVFHVDISINTPPTITNCPEDATIHWGETFSHVFTATDPDVGQRLTFSLCAASPEGATIDEVTGQFEWTSSAEDICDPTICVIVTDSCGAADTCEFNICVTNDPPVITCPGDVTICNGYPFETQVSAVDPDQGPYALFRLVSGPQGVIVDAVSGEITWDDPEPGSWEICVEASDEAPVCDPCSPRSADTCCFTLNVVALDLVIEKVHDQLQGHQTDVSIDFLHQGSNWPIAGYDLLIQYDASALSFLMATEGQFYLECEWEYFTYRYGVSGNCGGGACPSGILRVIAMAETTGGNLANHPDCYTNDGQPVPGPGSTTSTQLAVLKFLVSDDRTLECQFAPIRFIWYDCGDNGLSNIAGDTLYISNMVYDYSGEVGEPPVVQWNEITGLDNTFPTLTGALSPDCDTNDKTELVRCANFYNGGIDIICSDSIDAVGDINLNGIAYEIADAVMFTNYFISGLAAFDTHVEGSIAASDANRDGLTLSVADLVYVIRVVIGDAMPYAKETPPAIHSSYSVDDGVVTVGDNLDISGAALVIRGDIAPQLLVDGMDMKSAYDGTFTRIVITAPLEGAILGSFRGAFVGGVTGEIVSIDLATSDGATVFAKNVPVRFSLTQNYPNPFNPVTTIEFSLPEVTDYRLTIFNIQGQMVAAFEGRAESPGVYRVEWEGAQHASGVYLYRLEAGSGTFLQTKKMLLLK